jgi:hypothetical protein
LDLPLEGTFDIMSPTLETHSLFLAIQTFNTVHTILLFTVGCLHLFAVVQPT